MKKNIQPLFKAASSSKPLIIFEMANNHMGDVDHGIKIIREFHKIAKKFDFLFAFKFQFRDLDTFIHPDYKKRDDLKYIKRFSETKLTETDFKKLQSEVEKLGFISMCTPFDEISVDKVVSMNFDIIKVASCSFTDWPLLEKIVAYDKPIILSTAAAELSDIDNVVNFLQHRKKTFAILHCVGEYPTKVENLQLNQIDFLKERYPEVVIGFSTHEEPDATLPIQMALAKGARIFEKHIGVVTEKYPINAYSSTPEQVEKWLHAAEMAVKAGGMKGKKALHSEKEMADVRQFKRGVFAKTSIKKGERIDGSNTFLAFPNSKGQILANDLSKYTYFYATKNIKQSEPIISPKTVDIRRQVYKAVTRVQEMIKKSGIALPNKLEFELSHHYGIEKFDQIGATLVTCVNREYAKKLVIMFPGQTHPVHKHKKKEETFHILYGDFTMRLNGEEMKHSAGDIVTVERGVKHGFTTKRGGIFEEISSTHFISDSFYEDKEIQKNKNRKTHLTFWID